jgi:SAM-dependent methyltransferase
VADHQAGTGNTAQIEFWNSAATRAWADQYAQMDRAVAALTKELLDLAALQPGERVLDIGCGPGTTVLELAKHVGPGGHVRAGSSRRGSLAIASEHAHEPPASSFHRRDRREARLAEDAWNTRDPGRVVLAYTSDSRWRNRAKFLEGRDAVRAFFTRK